MPQKSTVLTAMTYLHADVYRHYYQRWRVLRFCSEWKEVVPRRSNDRQHSAILQIVKLIPLRTDFIGTTVGTSV